MFWAVFGTLLFIWFLGIVMSYTFGGPLYVVCVTLIAITMIRAVDGRRTT